jgi:hypothetical protein
VQSTCYQVLLMFLCKCDCMVSSNWLLRSNSVFIIEDILLTIDQFQHAPHHHSGKKFKKNQIWYNLEKYPKLDTYFILMW